MLSKTEWEAVEKSIMHSGQVHLKVNNMPVTFRLVRMRNRLRLAITFLVNGDLKPEWMDQDCPERLFFRPVTSSAWNAKSRAAIAKMSKRSLSRLGVDPNLKTTQYYPWWTQFKELQAHLTRHAITIEHSDSVGA